MDPQGNGPSRRRRPLAAGFALGPFAYLGGLLLLALLALSGARALLVLGFLERVQSEPHYPRLFLNGLRIDLLVASYLLVPPTLFLLLAPRRLVRAWHRSLCIYFALGLTLLASMEALSLQLLGETNPLAR